jgi:hypothetical protein
MLYIIKHKGWKMFFRKNEGWRKILVGAENGVAMTSYGTGPEPEKYRVPALKPPSESLIAGMR